MRQVAKKGLMTVVATGGVLAVTSGFAYADSGAQGAAVGSPGVLSGNEAQVPVHVPVNACGNTVDVIGALNPAFGNHCANVSRHRHFGHGGAYAQGVAKGSPGVGSGNDVQVPVHVPVNVCGNTVDVIGALNPAFGNGCGNVDSTPAPRHHCHVPTRHHCHKPPQRHVPPRRTRRPTEPQPWEPPLHHHHHHARLDDGPELAHTGADTIALAAIPASAGLLLGGFLLYRRGRRATVRG